MALYSPAQIRAFIARLSGHVAQALPAIPRSVAVALVASGALVPQNGRVYQFGHHQLVGLPGSTTLQAVGLPGFEPIIGHLDLFRPRLANSAQNDAAITAAVAWFNAAPGRQVEFPGGDVAISADIPAIVASRAEMIAHNTRLIRTDCGRFFTFGTEGVGAVAANNVVLKGFRFQVNGTPNPNDVAIDLVYATEVTGRDLGGSVASLIRFGSPTQKAARCHFEFSKGVSINQGASADQIVMVRNMAGCSISNLTANGSVPSSANPIGAFVRFQTVPGGIVDTFVLDRVHMQSFSVARPSADADGKPFGFVADLTYGVVTNVRTAGFCYADHTTNIGIHIFDAAGSTFASRAIDFSHVRTACDRGRAVVIDKQSGAPYVWASFLLLGNHHEVESADRVAEISGAGFLNCRMVGCALNETNNVEKLAAVLANADGWAYVANSIGPNTGGATGFAAAFETTNPALVNLLIALNQVHPGIPAEFVGPTWTTPDASAPRRRVPTTALALPLLTADPVAGEGGIYANSTIGRIGARIGGRDVVLGTRPVPSIAPPSAAWVATTMGPSATLTAAAQTAGRIDLYAWAPRRDLVITDVAINVTVAGAASTKATVLLYEVGATGRDATLVAASAEIATDAVVAGGSTAAMSYTVREGRSYYWGIRFSGAPTVSVWQAYQLPALPVSAPGTTPSVQARRTVAYATAAPTSWTFDVAEVTGNPGVAIWAKVA